MRRNKALRAPLIAILATVAMLFGALSTPVGAQGTATVNVNSWLCPQGYDEHEDCQKIGDVYVGVSADGVYLGEIVTLADTGTDFPVPVGSEVTLEIVGGVPENTTMESTALTFTAAEGSNPVTLVFVENQAPEPVDTDGDGLSDDDELELGTDPNNADSDGDNVQDGAEVDLGLDPLHVDTDGDGFTDGEELDLGSDPLDPASYPQGTEPNSFNVHVFNCPAGHQGKSTPDLCTDPADGVEFTVYIPGSEFAVTAETDASGAVSFGDLGSGEFVLHENLDDLGFSIDRYTAMCVGNNAPGVPEARQIEYTDLGNGEYLFKLAQGEIITCTWYNVPEAAGTAPTPTPVAPAKPVTALPNTGSGDTAGSDGGAVGLITLSAASLAILAAGVWTWKREAA